MGRFVDFSCKDGYIRLLDNITGKWDLLMARLSKLKIAPEIISELYSVKKGVYGGDFSKMFADQTWHPEDVVVAMAYLHTGTLAEDGK